MEEDEGDNLVNYFKGKVAIVTGGAAGIGHALCEELAQRGAVVVVTDINAEGAQQVVSTINKIGGRARMAHLDVSQAEDVHKLVGEIASEHGQLDYMFNNAGIGIGGCLQDLDLENWRRIIDVNLWGVIHGTMAAYKVMVKQGFGHIVNVSSGSGLVPAPGVAYCTTKTAVVGLSISLRAEAAGLGIKVSVVCPGFVRTGFHKALMNVTKAKYGDMTNDWSSMRMIDAVDCAHIILRGVQRNKGIIVVTSLSRVVWWLYRFQPALFIRLSSLYHKRNSRNMDGS